MPLIILILLALFSAYISFILKALTFIGIVFVIIPFLIARMSIKMGLVKTSFWLGRMSIILHWRDNFAGGLFYGWHALQKLPANKKEKLHHWLEHKLYERKSVLRSGTMVMQVLLKISYVSDSQIMELLRLLQGCNRRLIPGDINNYACRFMLARDLEHNSWEKIAHTAVQWHGFAWNPLADWLLEIYWCKKSRTEKKHHIRIFLKYLYAGMPSIAKHLPIHNANAEIASSDLNKTDFSSDALLKLKLAEWQLLQEPNNNDNQLNLYWNDYIQYTLSHQWSERINELGIYKKDESIEKITTSIKHVISLRNGMDAIESDVASSERDKNFNVLRIKIQAVTQRINQKKLMSGAYEFDAWCSIALLIQNLKKDSISESQIFYMLRNTSSNWVIELWNKADNKPLAFLICSFLYSMSIAVSDTEAENFFKRIIRSR